MYKIIQHRPVVNTKAGSLSLDCGFSSSIAVKINIFISKDFLLLLGRTIDENDIDREDSGLNDTSAGDDEPKDVRDQDNPNGTTCSSTDEKEAEETKTDSEKTEESIGKANEENSDPKTEPKEVVNEDGAAPVTEIDEKNAKIQEQNAKNDNAPKEQRVNLAKKVINEESKEVCYNIG